MLLTLMRSYKSDVIPLPCLHSTPTIKLLFIIQEMNQQQPDSVIL